MNSTQKYTFLTVIGLGLLVIMLLLFSSGPDSLEASVEENDSRDPSSFFAKTSELEGAASSDKSLYRQAIVQSDVSLCEGIESLEVKRKCLSRFLNDSEVSQMLKAPSSEVEVVVTESGSSFFQTAFFAVLVFLIVLGVLSYHHIHMYRQETHAVHNNVLVRHIKHELKSNVPHHEIKNRLIHVGWKVQSVEKAFEEALKRI